MIAWFLGVAIGIIFLSVSPFFPSTATIIEQVYKRANSLLVVYLSLVLICIGLMLEHYARKTVSENWGKRS